MLTSLKLLEFISNFFKNLQQLYLPNIIPDHMNFKKNTHTWISSHISESFMKT